MPCVRSWHPCEALVQVEAMLRLSVLLLIRWFRVRPPGAPPVFLSPFSLFPFSARDAGCRVLWCCRGGVACSGGWFRQAAAGVFRVAVAGGPAFAAAGCARPGRGAPYGGAAARVARVVLRRRRRVLGGSPAAARRWFSSCRVFQAVRMRWLRARSSVVVNSMRGPVP